MNGAMVARAGTQSSPTFARHWRRCLNRNNGEVEQEEPEKTEIIKARDCIGTHLINAGARASACFTARIPIDFRPEFADGILKWREGRAPFAVCEMSLIVMDFTLLGDPTRRRSKLALKHLFMAQFSLLSPVQLQ